jgi:hypothetical protein
VLEEGHQLRRVSLEGHGVKKMKFSIDQPKIFIDLPSLKERESFLDKGRFMDGPFKDIMDEV